MASKRKSAVSPHHDHTLPNQQATTSAGPTTRSSKKRACEDAMDGPQQKRKKRARPVSGLTTGDLTDGDRERLDALRRQPLVIVLDMVSVQCKRCGGTIKLSETCLYDPQHWITHRGRCDKWDAKFLASRREKNGMGSTRFSTPSLTPDDESSLTELSDKSERSASPVHGSQAETKPTGFTRGPLTSHIKSAEYLASSHPGADIFDLNTPLPDIPPWSYELLKLPSFIDAQKAEAERHRCTLSRVYWDESYDECDSDSDEADAEEDTGVSAPQSRPLTSPEPTPASQSEPGAC